MPEFQMNGKDSDAFTALDAFTQAYIEAAFLPRKNNCATWQRATIRPMQWESIRSHPQHCNA